jgi:hypothetical protein
MNRAGTEIIWRYGGQAPVGGVRTLVVDRRDVLYAGGYSNGPATAVDTTWHSFVTGLVDGDVEHAARHRAVESGFD